MCDKTKYEDTQLQTLAATLGPTTPRSIVSYIDRSVFSSATALWLGVARPIYQVRRQHTSHDCNNDHSTGI